MNAPPLELRLAADMLVAEIRRRLTSGTRPLMAAIDGRSGTGKSTLAQHVAGALGATVIPCDDFFAAGITDAGWEARTPAQRAADALDWRRLRSEALEPLREGKPARWRAFDFETGPRPDGTYAMQRTITERPPGAVIIVDGAYSARPELADLIDLTVLVEAPKAVRRERLAAREAPEFLRQWHARWDEAEDHYFTHIRPPSSFHLVITPAAHSRLAGVFQLPAPP